MNRVFFGDNGLTSTSANHLANIAKELVRGNQQFLSSASFTDVDVSLLSGVNNHQIEVGKDKSYLDKIPNLIMEISNMNSFIAWVREAIKEKEDYLSKVSNAGIYEYVAIYGIEIPSAPSAALLYKEEEAIAELGVKEYNEYLSLEAHAAVLGKYIHEDGVFSKARVRLNDKVNKPTEIKGSGSETIIYKYAPSVSVEEVNEAYFGLQSLHRMYNSRLNSYKARIKSRVDEVNLQRSSDLSKAYESYRSLIGQITADMAVWKIKERAAVSALKIIVPHDLQETVKMLQELNKA